MCCLSYHHNGFVATHALWYMMHCYSFLVPMNLWVLNKLTKGHTVSGHKWSATHQWTKECNCGINFVYLYQSACLELPSVDWYFYELEGSYLKKFSIILRFFFSLVLVINNCTLLRIIRNCAINIYIASILLPWTFEYSVCRGSLVTNNIMLLA